MQITESKFEKKPNWSSFYEWAEKAPDKDDIKETVRFLCNSYKNGRIPDREFEELIKRLLSFYVENSMENKFAKWIDKANDKYLRWFL